MSSLNERIKNVTKRNLKRKILRRFDDQIKFININSTVYMYPSTLTLEKTLVEFIELSEVLRQKANLAESDEIVMKAGEILRSE